MRAPTQRLLLYTSPLQEQYQRRIEHGLCTQCGRVEARAGITLCDRCAHTKAMASHLRYLVRVEKGICTACHCRPAKKGRRRCRMCLSHHARDKRLRASIRVRALHDGG